MGRAYDYDGPACVQWLLVYDRAKHTGTDETGEAINLTEHRKKKLIQEERRLRLMNDETEQRLAPVDLLKETLGITLNSIAAILDSIPAEVRRHCPHLNHADIDEIATVVAKIRNSIDGAKIPLPDEEVG